MKLAMTLVVRDEADILRANLDYHLANGVDLVIVTDHGSRDDTPAILREYERRGVLEAIRDEKPGHHQSRRVTRMVELARVRHGADWVINNDADEFWWPQVGSLRDVFAAVPAGYGQVSVPRRNFRPLPDPSAEERERPFYERLLYRELRSPSLDGQPKIANRPLPGIVLAPGNHSLRPDVPSLPLAGALEIFHFPMRSYSQFERKVLQIGEGYELLTDRSPGVGSDQLELLELLRAGRLHEHYREHVLDEPALARGLRSGAVVTDRRLRDFMRALPREARLPRQDEPFAAQLLQGAMDAVAELEQARTALARTTAEARDWRDRAERLVARESEMRLQLAGLSEQLDEVSQALELIRNSRLMRHTAPLRRLYYRGRPRMG